MSDNQEVLIKILAQFDPKPEGLNLVDSHRYFIKEGPVVYYNTEEKKSKPRQFFLFNDCLLLAKRLKADKYWLRYHIQLDGMRVEDEQSGWSDYRVISPGSDIPDVEFRLTKQKKTLIFFCKTPQEKNDWVITLRKATGQ